MYFEEFEVGQTYELEPISLSEEEIIEFAEKYDPQPIHINKEFAEKQFFKGIIASGYQTLGAAWGQWVRADKFGSEVIGGKGMDYVRWMAPVRPNDQLNTIVEITETIPQLEKGRGEVALKFTVTNQDGKVVLLTQGRGLLKSKASK